jgi:hypothetical protein
MTAPTYNLTIEQGADFAWTLTLQDDQNAPIDLTGAVLEGMIRAGSKSGKKLVDFTLGLNIPATDGVINVSLTEAQTAALPVDDSHAYDIKATYAGKTIRVIEGTVTVSQQVTHA